MSARVVEICSPWQQAADASDRIAELIADIPGGGHGYVLTAETRAELRQSAVLLHHAIGPLLRARAREVELYEQWAKTQEDQS